MTSFSALATSPCPPLGDFALAIARELRPVREAVVHAELDWLAGRLPADPDLDALGRLLAQAPLQVIEDGDPDGLLLDSLLMRRTGHPLAVAIAAAEIATRAGWDVHVAARDGWGVVEGAAARGSKCSHQVAFALLGALTEAYTLHGDLSRALRCAELRLELPVGEELGSRLVLEHQMLAARLN